MQIYNVTLPWFTNHSIIEMLRKPVEHCLEMIWLSKLFHPGVLKFYESCKSDFG